MSLSVPELIPRSILFGNPHRAQPIISGDATQVAYLASDTMGVLNVFVSVVGQNDHRQITFDIGRGVHFYRWAENCKCILYLQDSDGDENWHLFQAALGGSTPKDLTPYAGVKVDFFDTNPRFPNEVLVGLNLRNPSVFDVYRLYLDSSTIILDTENPGDVIRWKADHDFRIRAALVSNPQGGRTVKVRQCQNDNWKAIIDWGGDETFGTILNFNQTNDGLYLLTSLCANTSRLVEVDINTAEIRVHAHDEVYDIAGCLFDPVTQRIQAIAFLKTKQEWLIMHSSVFEDFAFLKEKCGGEIFVLNRDHRDKIWIVEFLSDDSAAVFYLYNRASRSLSKLFEDFPELKNFPLNKTQAFSFTASDGMMLHAFFAVPYWEQKRPLPLVILVHGGPWARDIQRYSPEVQRLTNRGYAVLQVNFRGSSGYGKAYMNAGDKEWGRRMQLDLIEAKDVMIQMGIADKKRIAIYGFSYGGYAALAGLAFSPEVFCCAVAAVAPANLISFLNSIPPYWLVQRSMFQKRIGDVDSDRDMLIAVSPLFHVDRIQAPLLIGHGANDPRVKQVESDQIVQTLRSSGKKVDYIVFDDEGHGFYKPINRLRFFAAVEKFFAEHLGGRLEPLKEDEIQV